MPGVTSRLIDWLTNYKTSDGKAQNSLSSQKPMSADEAVEVISDVHAYYQALMDGVKNDVKLFTDYGYELKF